MNCMNLKNVKEFLKPNRRKVVVFVILLFIITYVINILTEFVFKLIVEPYLGKPYSYIDSIFGLPTFYFQECVLDRYSAGYVCNYRFDSIVFIANLIIWYLISCLLIWIYDKVKKK